MNMLTKKIEKWAEERELHEADPKAQMLKATEEIGEIAGAIARNDIDAAEVEIGDGVVTLTILAMQLGLDINDCTKKAYEKIMNRNGKMINGVYVKEEDLHASD